MRAALLVDATLLAHGSICIVCSRHHWISIQSSTVICEAGRLYGAICGWNYCVFSGGDEINFRFHITHIGKISKNLPSLFSFKKDKIFQGTALKIAFQKSDTAYVKAIDEYLVSDPKNDPFNRFFGVLRNLAAHENSKARESIISLN